MDENRTLKRGLLFRKISRGESVYMPSGVDNLEDDLNYAEGACE